MIQSDENDFHAAVRSLLKITVAVRQIQIHDRKTQHHHSEIENAQLRSARPPPCRGSRKPEIERVQQEHEQRDHMLRIVKPILYHYPVHRDESQCRPDRDRNKSHEHAGLAHAFQQLQRRQAPDHVPEFVLAQEPLLPQENQAEYKRESERRVRQNAQGHMKRENGSPQIRLRQPVRRREVRREKEHQDERQDESSHGALSVIQLQSQVRQRQQPAEQRHRSIQIVIRHSMQSPRPLQKREIVRHQPQREEQSSQPPNELAARVQKTHVAAETQQIGGSRQNECDSVHARFRERASAVAQKIVMTPLRV